MDDRPDVPDGVGPHELRELELMLSGEKPLAMFIDEDPGNFIIPEADFEPHVRAGTFIKGEAIYPKPNDPYAPRYVYFALSSEGWRIDALHAINEAIHCGRRKVTDEDEIEIGSLLGYSPEQVEAFLDWRNRHLP
ncbi:MAG: hypothetical protein QF521_17320 [Alphaproteobacteria bacterium]|jgi:hypothetical protein|nr:hypothetical protein [Alphaproteobacteria bacterium]MDP6875287.1 hypothetical protein [Alphaproteobacteria bacterium]